ncbi:hypothetical protein Neosp_004010 [[Neocosmospora] mangrovei]
MQYFKVQIDVKGLSIKSTSARPYKGQRDLSLNKSTSLQATALVWNLSGGGRIAIAFVEKAIGSLAPHEHYGIHLMAELTWSLAIFDNGTETSNLRVVSELDHDVVFGQGAGCGDESALLANSSSHPNASWEAWLGIAAVFEHLIRLEDSELSKKLADGPFVKSFALSCGFIFEGEESVEACASLLRQRIEDIKHDRQPKLDNPPLNIWTAPIVPQLNLGNPLLTSRTATPVMTPPSEETESSVSSSEFDKDELVHEMSTAPSEITLERHLHQRPSFLHRNGRAHTEIIHNAPIQAAQVARGVSPNDSLGSWQLVENAPLVATAEDGGPSQAYQAETKEQEELFLDQSQISDFDMHPGHKHWEWVKDRERWKRRGRSGQEEIDWFPESFA